jgi:hypothetical protein
MAAIGAAYGAFSAGFPRSPLASRRRVGERFGEMAFITGWVAVALVALAGGIPAAQWLRAKRRLAPDAPRMRLHAAIGMAVAAVAFAHTLVAVPILGTPRAVGGGTLALAAGGAAFFVIVAHIGVGLQLRNPRLRERKRKRRTHLGTALAIVVTVGVHVVALLRAAG